MSNDNLEQDIKDLQSLPDDETHDEDGFPAGMTEDEKRAAQINIDENTPDDEDDYEDEEADGDDEEADSDDEEEPEKRDDDNSGVEGN